jgi:hypothetical protein
MKRGDEPVAEGARFRRVSHDGFHPRANAAQTRRLNGVGTVDRQSKIVIHHSSFIIHQSAFIIPLRKLAFPPTADTC